VSAALDLHPVTGLTRAQMSLRRALIARRHRAWCEARALKELFAGMQGGEEGGVIEDVEELAAFGDEGGFEA
jgi:hypothetical protein